MTSRSIKIKGSILYVERKIFGAVKMASSNANDFELVDRAERPQQESSPTASLGGTMTFTADLPTQPVSFSYEECVTDKLAPVLALASLNHTPPSNPCPCSP